MHSLVANALAALCLVAPATAHSWVEDMWVIDPKSGLFTSSAGYIRNNTKRTVPGFSDPLMVHILPGQGQPSIEERDTIPATDTTGVNSNDPMCKKTQQSQYQADGSPRLQAAPGALVSLRYQENGHVTLPQNQKGKPSNRGSVYIYGTTEPKDTELFLDVFGQWNADGTGGNKRGKLLATQPFDDGHCYQVNSGNISISRQAQYPHTSDPLMGANLYCQNNIAIPTDAPTGKPYTIYWVWDWPTEAGADPNLPNGKAELYTSCMDVDVLKPASKRRVKARQQPSPSAAANNLNSAAIPSYVSSLTASPAPTGASPVVSAQASAASPTSPAAQQAAGSNSMASSGVAAYIETAVSAAIAAQLPKMPLTVTVTAGAGPSAAAAVAPPPGASPMTAGAVASAPAAAAVAPPPGASPTAGAVASAPAAAAVAPPPGASPMTAGAVPSAPAAAAVAPSPAPTASTSAPAQAPSMPPASLDINAPILSASPSFSGTASPVVASPAVASPAVASPAVASPAVASPAVASPAGSGPESSTTPVVAPSGASSQNGTTAATAGKRQCDAKTCKSKRQSKVFGKKSG